MIQNRNQKSQAWSPPSRRALAMTVGGACSAAATLAGGDRPSLFGIPHGRVKNRQAIHSIPAP
ncbi:MAG: hypothetical protein GY937_27285 [bacterium]|nr:hypothetical protein [bacterium]